MSKTITLKNIGTEDLAFAGFPLIPSGKTIEVSEADAVILLRNDNMQEDKKAKPSATDKKEEK